MNNKVPPERFRAAATGEGKAIWFLGTLVYIRATAADTEGAFTLIEQLAPCGFGPPLHVHHVEDELFYVLDGIVRFRCGNKEVVVQRGGSVFLPKEVLHGFRVEGDSPARLLQITSPAGFDRFVGEAGIPAPEERLPPPGPPPEGLLEKIAILGEKYHFTVVGPPI